MQLSICCIFDKAIEAYNQPVIVRHPGEAIRSFSDEIQNPDSQLSRHPSDFVLYLIGSFDPNTGWVQGHEPTTLITGSQCVKPPVKE